MNSRWVRITCREAHVLLSERMDRPLPAWRRLRLRLHLAFCDMCTRVNRQMSVLREGMRSLDR